MHLKIIIATNYLLFFVSTISIADDLIFIENKGQWQTDVLYKTTIANGSLFFEKNSFTWHFTNINEISGHAHAPVNPNQKIRGHAFKVIFENANTDILITGADILPQYHNYFIGNNPDLWQSSVSCYAGVIYYNIYNGIDLEVYSSAGNLKYDFIVHPGADPNQIQLRYEGLDSLQLQNQNLELYTSLNKLIELKPHSYIAHSKYVEIIPSNYTLHENQISFSFPDGYNSTKTLVIDPTTLIFSSYSGSTEDNWGYSATYDEAGNLYGAGIVFGTGYPVTLGAYETDFQGGSGFFPCDIAISKFNADGTDLIYSTYLGGSANELPHSLIVDNENQLIVYGSTGSDNFPVTAGAFDNTFNGGPSVTVTYVIEFTDGSDVFVTKFSADGGALIGSTYMGGNGSDGLNLGTTLFNYGDHARGEVVTDLDGNCYIASSTNSTNLPTSGTVFQPTLAGTQDGFIAKLNNNLSSLIWCSYIGGEDDDGAYSMKLAPDGSVLVCGGTVSNDFPTTTGVLNESYKGGTHDGFVTRINSNASVIINSTFIGTNNYDQVFLLEEDAENNVYVSGQSSGAYPVTPGVYSNPGSSQFITKLNPDLSSILFSTVFGSASSVVNISPTALLVDECDQIYVSGWGGSVNSGFNPATGNVNGMPLTADAFDDVTNGSDFYFIVLGNDADELIYATYFGSPIAADHVDGGTSRFDKTGIIYQAVCAGCGNFDDFPTTDGVWSNTNNSANCNLGVAKFAFSFTGPSAAFTLTPDNGCVPLTVNFTNNSIDAENFFWDFGDGSTSNLETPNHIYTEPGEYTVTLIVSDPDACIPEDTLQVSVNVFSLPEADFTFSPDTVSVFGFAIFEDLSTDAASWQWDFGDGTGSPLQNPSHAYPAAGTYTVCLSITNQDGCSDSICSQIEVFEISILDVPNAFSPNGDGINDFFIPVNYGLADFEFRIYNRWGQLVFITNDTSIGWDGYFEGVEQEMGTYAYIVTGKGLDNTDYYRQGNLTLVR